MDGDLLPDGDWLEERLSDPVWLALGVSEGVMEAVCDPLPVCVLLELGVCVTVSVTGGVPEGVTSGRSPPAAVTCWLHHVGSPFTCTGAT